MLGLPPSIRIYFATEVTDVRNGTDDLRAIVEGALRRDPHEGHGFVFVGKAKDKAKDKPKDKPKDEVKTLFRDPSSFVLHSKRLEKRRFHRCRRRIRCSRITLPTVARVRHRRRCSRARRAYCRTRSRAGVRAATGRAREGRPRVPRELATSRVRRNQDRAHAARLPCSHRRTGRPAERATSTRRCVRGRRSGRCARIGLVRRARARPPIGSRPEEGSTRASRMRSRSRRARPRGIRSRRRPPGCCGRQAAS